MRGAALKFLDAWAPDCTPTAMQKPPFRPKGHKRPENDDEQPGSSRDKLTAEAVAAAFTSAVAEAFRIVDEKLEGQDKREPDNAAAVFLTTVLTRMIVRWGPKATAKAIEAAPDMIGQAAKYLWKDAFH